MDTERILAKSKDLTLKREALVQERKSLEAKIMTIKTWRKNRDRKVDLGTLSSYDNQIAVFGRRILEIDTELTGINKQRLPLHLQIANSQLIHCPMCGHSLHAATKGAVILECDSGHSYRLVQQGEERE